MSIRIGVIGAGLMGADHAKIIAQDLPNATLQVICDQDPLRAKRIADLYGAKDISTEPLDVIASKDIDALIIASPDFTHAPLSLETIKHGKKLLCEKPLSQSSAECIEVMKAEQAAGQKFIQLGFMRRYDQAYLEIKQALDNGNLGRALMMHNFHRNVETPASDFTGAMAITNSAPHEFDVVRYVLGCEYTSITAFAPKRSDARVAPVFLVIETEDHQLVNIEINNNAAYGYDVRAELVGELGSIAINHMAFTKTDVKLAAQTQYESDWRGRYAESYRRQNRAFLKFVETDVFPQIASNAWDGYCSTIVAEAGVQALMTGQKTIIKMITKLELYQ